MTILELDLGNSRLKWRALKPDEEPLMTPQPIVVPKSESYTHAIESMLETIVAAIVAKGVGSISRVRIASVRDQAANEKLAASIEKKLGVQAEFAVTSAVTSGVSNAYQVPAHMGVDRWSAVLGAYAYVGKGRSFAVVDAGSAMTIDLAAGAKHLGGYILPGYQMQLNTLLGGTDNIASAANYTDLSGGGALPDNTHDAIHSGVLISLVGAVDQALKTAFVAESNRPALLFTGGDAELLAGVWKSNQEVRVPADVTISDTLVFDGLRYLLP